jgi:hypothetical protein
MAYSAGAMERAMKAQEVILRALSGQLTWLQAADIVGRSPRSIRRLRWRFEHRGYDGLLDHRRQTPSPKRRRWPRWSACSVSIASAIRTSTCRTFWASPAGSTTSPSATRS